jgi:thymidylate synthase
MWQKLNNARQEATTAEFIEYKTSKRELMNYLDGKSSIPKYFKSKEVQIWSSSVQSLLLT